MKISIFIQPRCRHFPAERNKRLKTRLFRRIRFRDSRRVYALIA